MKWNDLSMRDRASLIRTYIQNGITSLDTMRDHYNSFQEGGPLTPEETKEHEEVFRTVDPSWGVPNVWQSLSAWRQIKKNRNNPDYKSEGTSDDNAYFRKYLNLPYDEKRLPKSKYKPTVAENPDAVYYGLNKTIRDGILNQLDTARISKAIERTKNAPGYYGSRAGEQRVEQLEEAKEEITKLLSGEKDRIVIKEEYYPDFKVEDSRYNNSKLTRYPTSPLKNYTISRSPDGSYISVYDKYDFPNRAKFILPDKVDEFEIYDRIYLPKGNRKDIGGPVDEGFPRYQGYIPPYSDVEVPLNTEYFNKREKFIKDIEKWPLHKNLARAEFADSLKTNPDKALAHFYRYKTALNTGNIESLYRNVDPWYEEVFPHTVNMNIAKKIYNSFEGTPIQKAAATANSGVESEGWTLQRQTGGPAKGWFGLEPIERKNYKKFLGNTLPDIPENETTYISRFFNQPELRDLLVTPYDRVARYMPDSLEMLKRLSEEERLNNKDFRSTVAHWEYTTPQAWKDWESGDIRRTTKAFEGLFERAGKPNIERRYRMAEGIAKYPEFFSEDKNN